MRLFPQVENRSWPSKYQFPRHRCLVMGWSFVTYNVCIRTVAASNFQCDMLFINELNCEIKLPGFKIYFPEQWKNLDFPKPRWAWKIEQFGMYSKWMFILEREIECWKSAEFNSLMNEYCNVGTWWSEPVSWRDERRNTPSREPRACFRMTTEYPNMNSYHDAFIQCECKQTSTSLLFGSVSNEKEFSGFFSIQNMEQIKSGMIWR